MFEKGPELNPTKEEEQPEPEFDTGDMIDDMQTRLEKDWSEFSIAEKEEAVQTAINEKGLVDALRYPVILRFFFETGGEARWGAPDFSGLKKE